MKNKKTVFIIAGAIVAIITLFFVANLVRENRMIRDSVEYVKEMDAKLIEGLRESDYYVTDMVSYDRSNKTIVVTLRIASLDEMEDYSSSADLMETRRIIRHMASMYQTAIQNKFGVNIPVTIRCVDSYSGNMYVEESSDDDYIKETSNMYTEETYDEYVEETSDEYTEEAYDEYAEETFDEYAEVYDE